MTIPWSPITLCFFLAFQVHNDRQRREDRRKDEIVAECRRRGYKGTAFDTLLAEARATIAAATPGYASELTALIRQYDQFRSDGQLLGGCIFCSP